MTAKRIEELCHYIDIPAGADSISGLSMPELICDESDRLALALTTPDFGWRLVLHYHEIGLSLPLDIIEVSLRRAYWHVTGEYTDKLIQGALALEHPANRAGRRLLRAYLLCRDLSPENVASRVGKPLQFIQTYAELFFNVLDRKDETFYCATLAFPEGRLPLLRQRQWDQLDPDQMMLQLALDEGSAGVDWLAGLRPDWLTGQSVQSMRAQLEAMVFESALFAAKCGLLNQPDQPIFKRALKLIEARRRRGRGTTGEETQRLTGPSLGEALALTMNPSRGANS